MPDQSSTPARRSDGIPDRPLILLPDVSPASMVARQKVVFAEMLKARARAHQVSEAVLERGRSAVRPSAIGADPQRGGRDHVPAEVAAPSHATDSEPIRSSRSTLGDQLAGNASATETAHEESTAVTLLPAIGLNQFVQHAKKVGMVAAAVLALCFVVGSLRSTANKVAQPATDAPPPKDSMTVPPSGDVAVTDDRQSSASAVASSPAVGGETPSLASDPSIESQDRTATDSASNPIADISSNRSPGDPALPSASVGGAPEKPSAPPLATPPGTSPPGNSGESSSDSTLASSWGAGPPTPSPGAPVSGPAVPVPAVAVAETAIGHEYPHTHPATYLYPNDLPGLPLTSAQGEPINRVPGSHPSSAGLPANGLPTHAAGVPQYQGQLDRSAPGMNR